MSKDQEVLISEPKASPTSHVCELWNWDFLSKFNSHYEIPPRRVCGCPLNGPFQTKCKCQKIRIFRRNFFASKNHVAEIFWQILCMTLQKIYSSNYIHCHLSLDHTHFTARWNLHSSVIYTIYHLQMHIFDDQKLEAPTFNCWFISFIYCGNSLFQGFQRKIGSWKIHL